LFCGFQVTCNKLVNIWCCIVVVNKEVLWRSHFSVLFHIKFFMVLVPFYWLHDQVLNIVGVYYARYSSPPVFQIYEVLYMSKLTIFVWEVMRSWHTQTVGNFCLQDTWRQEKQTLNIHPLYCGFENLIRKPCYILTSLVCLFFNYYSLFSFF